MTPKPTRFSDPYSDWEDCEELFCEILRKDAADLVVDDYQVIFARHLPAANCHEGLYYVPHCLDYMSDGREIDTSRYPDSLLWWIQHYAGEIKDAGQWPSLLERLKDTAVALLSDFELYDLTEEQCEQMGWDYRYSICPYNHYTVHEFFDDLTIWPDFSGVVDHLLTHLRALDSVPCARWYVQLAHHSREWCMLSDLGHPHLDNVENKERIFHQLHAFRYLREAEDVAREMARAEGKDKYVRLVML